jgi:hypothetical protein
MNSGKLKVFAFLDFYAALFGSCLPTFRNGLENGTDKVSQNVRKQRPADTALKRGKELKYTAVDA